jgi:DNA-binding transcriptional LysR family regulator
VLVCDPAHHFAGRDTVRLRDIAEEQLVQFDRTSSYTELTNALFRDAGVRPQGTMELDNIDAAKKMVQEGLGVALLPQTSVRQELEVGLLRQVEISDAKAPRPQLVAIRRRGRGEPTGTVATFLATVAEMQGELSP